MCDLGKATWSTQSLFRVLFKPRPACSGWKVRTKTTNFGSVLIQLVVEGIKREW